MKGRLVDEAIVWWAQQHSPADADPSPTSPGAGDPVRPEGDSSPSRHRSELDTLYRSQKARLLRFFTRRASRDEATDLVQETFLRFASAERPSTGAISCPEAYMSRIAGNLLKDRAKFAARRSLNLHVPVDDAILCTPDLDRALEARDMLRRLEAAMLELKPLTREIFMAHRLDGYSYKEIAERTGLSTKAVEKQMSRAIAHVTRSMIGL